MKRIVLVVMIAALCLTLLAGLSSAGDKPGKIVFVCTGNTCRSPMAEGIAKKEAAAKGYDLEISSGGTNLDPLDSCSANLNAIVIMSGHGIKIADHKPQAMSAEAAQNADLILTMTDSHKKNVLKLFPEAESYTFTLIEYVTGKPGNISDPWGMDLSEYAKTADQLDKLVPEALKKFNEN